MKNKYFIYVIFFMILIMSLLFYKGEMDKKEIGSKEINLKVNKKESSFVNRSVENIVEDFKKVSKKNKINLEKFSKISYEGRIFYYSKILNSKNASYMVEYTGFDVGGLFFKVDSITGENLSYVEKLILNLIEISDTEMDDVQAKQLYTELLLYIPEEEAINVITHENGLEYGIQINKENGEFIFFVY